jgi:hypothetical protein
MYRGEHLRALGLNKRTNSIVCSLRPFLRRISLHELLLLLLLQLLL